MPNVRVCKGLPAPGPQTRAECYRGSASQLEISICEPGSGPRVEGAGGAASSGQGNRIWKSWCGSLVLSSRRGADHRKILPQPTDSENLQVKQPLGELLRREFVRRAARSTAPRGQGRDRPEALAKLQKQLSASNSHPAASLKVLANEHQEGPWRSAQTRPEGRSLGALGRPGGFVRKIGRGRLRSGGWGGSAPPRASR
jgi:hypothetical protein